MDIVINTCFGGFNLSYEAVMLFSQHKGLNLKAFTLVYDTDGDEYAPYVPGNGYEPYDLLYFINGDTSSEPFDIGSIERNDPMLALTVKELGYKANGNCANLKIVTVPDDVAYYIHDYDGVESVHECHRIWR